MVVVIPCYDEGNLLRTLASLEACTPTACAVEVIVVLSSSEADDAALKARNLATLAQAEAWAQEHAREDLQFHFLHFPELPRKHAGVGLTRKIGMDEAVHRFGLADSPRGIIVSLDADTVCDSNYLRALELYFDKHRKVDSCSLTFAFEVEADAESFQTDAILRIALAERILVAGLRACRHPYAFHTLGAAMAVRVGAYQTQAGMNRRKTGEDFDFLQKFIELGVHGDCVDAQVFPSGRSSQRKPNGIGQRVAQYCAAPDPDFPVFAVESFQALEVGLKAVPTWFGMDANALAAELDQFPAGFKEFMQLSEFPKVIAEIQRYTSNAAAFEKRFYRWFNSLRTFQYFGFCRDHHFPNRPILEVGNAMLAWMGKKNSSTEEVDLAKLLALFSGAE